MWIRRSRPDGDVPGGRPRRDLVIRDFPTITVGDGHDRATVLEELRDWAEGQTEETIAWYLQDKARRRRSSRILRACAILLGVVGGVVPLLSAAGAGSVASWGYVFLAAAGGCLAFDHFFGLSSAWMRDIATAQALQRSLTEFRIDWVTAGMRERGADPAVGEPLPESVHRRRERLVRALVNRTADLVDAETGEWLTEFRTNISHLNRQTGWAPSGGGDRGPGQPAEPRDERSPG